MDSACAEIKGQRITIVAKARVCMGFSYAKRIKSLRESIVKDVRTLKTGFRADRSWSACRTAEAMRAQRIRKYWSNVFRP